MTSNNILLTVDIGGTFTDIVVLNTLTQEIAVEKMLTTYPDPAIAVLDGIRKLIERTGIPSDSIAYVVHGTTLIANTLIERKGAPTALLTTAGFRDALEIGNEGRYDMYDLALVKPTPLVERRLRFDIPERIKADGNIIQDLDEEALQDVCRQLEGEGISAVAICFLHAFTNPSHEIEALKIVRRMLPDMAVSVSHQVAPGMREYPRTSTTVANAYVQPITEQYMARVEDGLRTSGVNAPLNIMLSNGGTTTVHAASDFPIRLVESGPAGGALAGVYWGSQIGDHNIFAFDMGGTTAKAVLTKDGELTITNKAEVAHIHRFKRGSGLPLMVPMIELIEIGAGGGSIAHLNNLGLPTVGPESAGSTPGPASYARGGKQPTVTDADLLIGFLNPDYFADGTIKLDVDAARTAYTSLAESLNLSVDRLARGVHELVNENMAAAARVHAAERGLEIRRYSMVATGGAGPVHACGVAEKLGLKHIIVPPFAGAGSAFGFITAPISFDFTRSYVSRLDALDLDEINSILDNLENEGRAIVEAAGVRDEVIQVQLSIDIRYIGQGYEVRVPFKKQTLTPTHIEQIQKAFEEEYKRFYGQLTSGVPIEAVNWRIVISSPKPEIGKLSLGSKETETNTPYASRPVIFNAASEKHKTPVYHRNALSTGWQADGPLIIEEAASTTIVLPNWSAQLDESGCLLLTREDKTS
ncbi:MAG TPA: hydantoinase/oxoprolinase family protein [Anaerolineales bacterium]|nr:hydantoinase/oxoprolinase family protein [Anaerolineales bacterium]